MKKKGSRRGAGRQQPATAPPPPFSFRTAGFAAAAGLLVAIGIAKLGNPIIFEELISAPKTLEKFFIDTWPLAWGYPCLILVGMLSALVLRLPRQVPHWIVWLPAAWLLWELVAATQTIDPSLTLKTLGQFAGCTGAFYLGYFAMREVSLRYQKWFWVMVWVGLAWVLWRGFNQHYGGLAALRRYIHSQPGWQSLSPSFLAKIRSNRIFSTLVYPNALAGAILLLLPASVASLWRATASWSHIPRGVCVGILLYAGLACLYWSGSKAGWLLALGMLVVIFLHGPLPRTARIGAVAILLLLGLAGFAWKYSGYFNKGARSAAARLDYWHAAWVTFKAHPLVGTGPGTFSISYGKIKPPNAEMARLAHNDYLEQASDSGVLGFLVYGTLWAGSLLLLYRTARKDAVRFAIWLGLAGWAAQGCVEFGLYIPGLAWPAMLFLGWLWSMRDGEALTGGDAISTGSSGMEGKPRDVPSSGR